MSETPNLDREWLAAKQRASAAYDSGDAVAMLEGTALAELHSRKRDFVAAATGLARRLLDAADRVEADPANHFTTNALGEVQSQGTEVDRLCYEIGMLRKMLADLGAARKAAGPPTEPGPTSPTPRARLDERRRRIRARAERARNEGGAGEGRS